MRPETTTTADTLQDAKIKSSKCKLVKSIKPLVNYKFYLDIERHNILLKIESKIRELGGSIEFFLTKEITHFITDKKEQNNYSFVASSQQQQSSAISAPQSPNYLSPSYARTPSSNDLKTNSRIRTRADAMLHRARKGTCETIENNRKSTTGTATNPSQIAESWGTPVWHTEYALKFLEKVYSYIKERYIDNTNHTKSPTTSLRHKSKHAQVFKGHYIKIESSQKGHYRPYYKIFNSKWPVINLKPHKKGIFPLTAVDENYFYNSETKTIGKRKPNGTAATAAAAAIVKSIKGVKKIVNKSSINDLKMTRKNRTSSKQQHIRVKTTGTGTTNATMITNNTTTTTTTNSFAKQNLSSEKQCGFCEICRVEYDALTVHLKSESHQNFVKNETNFLALDSLIKTSANVDKFLSLNNKMSSIHIENSVNQCNDISHSPSKRTSKRISNNGSQLKATLPPPAAPPPPLPPSPHSQKSSPPTATAIIRNKSTTTSSTSSSPHKGHQQDHQIEILEKTTTLGHTRQTRQHQQQQHHAVSYSTLQLPNGEQYENDGGNSISRARRQSVKKINYAEPKEDEEIPVEDLMVNYQRHQRKKKPKIKDKEKPIIRNRDSSQTDFKQLPLPTSLLYRVVETNPKKTKVQSPKKNNSATLNQQQQNEKEIKKECEENKQQREEQEQPEKKKPSPIIVKIRKVRQSELSILSGEAANFMFPKRQVSSEPTDVDRQTTSEGRGMCSSSTIDSNCGSSSINKSNDWKLTERKAALKRKQSNSSNLCSTTTTKDVELSPIRKKRRLDFNYREDENEEQENVTNASTTPPAAVSCVHRPENYLELRSSPRLSLQKNPPLRTYGRRKANKKKTEQQTTRNGKILKTAKGKEDTIEDEPPKIPLLDDIVNEKLVKYKFAFERIPGNELWYQVFRRQDEGFEKSFEYFGSTAYRKLPYEMGPLRPSTKPLCALCHINCKSSEHVTAATASTSTAAATTSNKSHEKESKSPKQREYKFNNDNNSTHSEPNATKIKRRKEKKSMSRAAALLNLEMPRKSPREHASTLAILSCLLQRKNAQQQQTNPNAATSSSSSFSQVTVKTENFADLSEFRMETEQNDGVSNQICTQISENVKRLRRGEKASIAAVSAAATNSLLELKKKSIKQKKNIRKLPCKSENSLGNSNSNKSAEQHVNALKLKREIDAFLTSIPLDDDLLGSSSQLSLPIAANDDEFTPFSQDFDLYELLRQQDVDGCAGRGGGISNKSGYDGGGASSCNNSFSGNNRFRMFKVYPSNKKRKNKTGWPTTKKRTVTRHHTQQLKLQQLLLSKKPPEDMNGIIKSEASTTKSVASTTISATTTTATKTTATTNTFKYPRNENDMNDISTHSPITPPESDNEEEEGGGDNDGTIDDQHTSQNGDEDDTTCADKNDCDETVSNSTTDCRNSTTQSYHHHPHHNHHLRLQHPTLLHHVHHNNHHHLHNHQHNFSASDKTDASDIFTVSSDSLDTVLDVGSQIKSEDQEEIIASSKCNGSKLNNNQNHQIITTSPIGCDDDAEVDCDDDATTVTAVATPKSPLVSSSLKKFSVMSPNSSGSSINSRKMKFPNSIKIDNTPTKLINSRKLSNNNAKDLKVVVVVRRERNNSVCSSSASGGGGGGGGESKSSSSQQQSSNEVKLSSETEKQEEDANTTPTKEVVIAGGNNNNNGNDSMVVHPSRSATTAVTTQISPRRLRKPRGRWYRER